MASISIRESIRWLPEKPAEPTSTIVLTSPGKRFVDLRILHRPEKTPSSDADEDLVPPSRLDWALAGTSSSVQTPDRGPDTTHSQWKHWIDSRTTNVAGVVDEGFMAPLGNRRTLEVGAMVNPETGLVTEYEEVWVDPDPDLVPGDAGFQMAVLSFEGSGETERGSLVRVGRLCQALLRLGQDVKAERWEWREDGGWKRTKRVGDGTGLPCEAVLGQWHGEEGGKFVYQGRTWTVLEAANI